MAHTRHALKDLDLEWAARARSTVASRQLRKWRQVHACFVGLGSLGALIEATRHGNGPDALTLVFSTRAMSSSLVVAAMEAIRHAAGKRKPWPLSSILRRTHRVLRRAVLTEDRWRSSMVLTDCPRNEDTVTVEPAPWR